jgi:hypothetical protein
MEGLTVSKDQENKPGTIIVPPDARKAEVALDPTWFEERDAMLADAEAKLAAGITDELAYRGITAMVGTLTKMRTGLDKSRKEIKEPYLTVGKLIDSTAKDAIAPVEAMEKRVKDAATVWYKADLERQRVEREAAERAEQERIEKALAEKAAADEAQREVLGDIAFDDEGDDELDIEEVVLPTVAAPKARGASVQTVTKWDRDDVKTDDLPVTFLSLDPVKVNGWLKENTAMVEKKIADNEGKPVRIHGVLFKQEVAFTGRG